jgi:hypothetical protein
MERIAVIAPQCRSGDGSPAIDGCPQALRVWESITLE